MTRVKLGGRELNIPDELVTEYVAKGYSVIDSKGNTLRLGKAITYEQAIVENNRLEAENKKFRAVMTKQEQEIEELKALVNTLTEENLKLKNKATIDTKEDSQSDEPKEKKKQNKADKE